MNRFHRWFCRSDAWKKTISERVPWVLEGIETGDDLLEVGPGPGLTTDILRHTCPQLTCLEIDPALASSLKKRLGGSNVRVLEGDATKMPFPDSSFSAGVCFTMLHHVPSPQLQDRLLAEVFRVLRPGGVFAGSDSRWSPFFHLIHLFDTMVVVDPATFAARLEKVGFTDVQVDTESKAFRFNARKTE